MIWWVYNRVRLVRRIDEVYVVTDNEDIRQACEALDIACMMTSEEHRTSTERLYEAAQKVHADVYVCVNGDEPLIEPELVEQVIPEMTEGFFAANLMTKVQSPVEVVDNTNIKVVTDCKGNALFMSLSLIHI